MDSLPDVRLRKATPSTDDTSTTQLHITRSMSDKSTPREYLCSNDNIDKRCRQVTESSVIDDDQLRILLQRYKSLRDHKDFRKVPMDPIDCKLKLILGGNHILPRMKMITAIEMKTSFLVETHDVPPSQASFEGNDKLKGKQQLDATQTPAATSTHRLPFQIVKQQQQFRSYSQQPSMKCAAIRIPIAPQRRLDPDKVRKPLATMLAHPAYYGNPTLCSFTLNPTLIEALASQINQQVACPTAGLCNSMASVISRKFHAANSDQVFDGVLGMCGRLSPFSDVCSSIILAYLDGIFAELLQNITAENICLVNSVCASNFNQLDDDSAVETRTKSNFGFLKTKQAIDDIPC